MPAFDQNLGSFQKNSAATTIALTTAAAAAPYARIFVAVGWQITTGSPVDVASVTGGGLVFTRASARALSGNNCMTVYEARAGSAGLASGTVLTATFDAAPNTNGDILACSFTDLVGIVETIAVTTGAGSTSWTDTVAALGPNDVVLAFSMLDSTTVTANAPVSGTEIHDIWLTGRNRSVASEYLIASASGSQTLSGTWSGNTGSTANLTVALAIRSVDTWRLPMPFLPTLDPENPRGVPDIGFIQYSAAAAFVTTPVSAALALVLDTLAGIATSGDLQLDTTRALTAAATEPVEAVQGGVLQTAAGPVEAAAGVTAAAQEPLDAATGLASAAQQSVEAVQPVASSSVEPLEAAQGVTPAAATSPVEASQGVAATASDPIDASGAIAATATEPVDSTQAINRALSATAESLQAVVAALAGAVDAAGGVAAVVVGPVEALQGVTSTTTDPVEAQGAAVTAVSTTAALPVESLQAAAASVLEQLDAVQGVAAVPVVQVETLAQVLAALTTTAESARAIATPVVVPLETGAGVLRATLVPVESLQGVAVAIVVPAETLSEGGVSAVVALTHLAQVVTTLTASPVVLVALTETFAPPVAYGAGPYGSGPYGGTGAAQVTPDAAPAVDVELAHTAAVTVTLTHGI